MAGIALATSEKRDACDSNLDMLQAYSNQFYYAFKRLQESAAQERKEVPILSRMEKEVLKWIVAGKTYNETADILNVTINTVRTHIKNISLKLDASNMITAVVKAIAFGFIDI